MAQYLENLPNAIGLIGVLVYLGSYAALQFGLLSGNSYAYACLNLLAAACVLVSLTVEFNFSSMLIQAFWILISIGGMARLYIITARAKFSDEEAQFIAATIPRLTKHLSRRILNQGVWHDGDKGTVLTVQGEANDQLVFLLSGNAAIKIKGRKIGKTGAGVFIGELTAMEGGPANASVTLTKPSRYLSISVEALHRLAAQNSEIDLALALSFANATKAKLLNQNTKL